MNPNSTNQIWSKWTFTVHPQKLVDFATVKQNCARFGRQAFGSVSQMRITQNLQDWVIEIRTEGVPVHEPAFVTYMYENWCKFFYNGFGVLSTVACSSKLEAGSRQDGTPADQLIIVPPIHFNEETRQ
jgi:hypothetical protein